MFSLRQKVWVSYLTAISNNIISLWQLNYVDKKWDLQGSKIREETFPIRFLTQWEKYYLSKNVFEYIFKYQFLHFLLFFLFKILLFTKTQLKWKQILFYFKFTKIVGNKKQLKITKSCITK